MFDAHRRDILNFDNYMDLKKPGFGGPASAIDLRDSRGNLIDKNPKLEGFKRTVERDPAFSHPVYDPTYKAMTHDLVYKQEKKKPFTYEDPYHTAIPVIEMDPLKEGKAYSSFHKFIYEAIEDETEDSEEDPYDPIAAAHAEYESPMDRRFSSEDWVNAQRDETGLVDDEEEERIEATRSNRMMSDLRQIENKLKSFETGENSDEDFGANPMESPFDEIPDWVKELEANREDGYSAGGNPDDECDECGDADWMK